MLGSPHLAKLSYRGCSKRIVSRIWVSRVLPKIIPHKATWKCPWFRIMSNEPASFHKNMGSRRLQEGFNPEVELQLCGNFASS